MHLNKRETVELGRSLGDECMRALGHSVTCYNGKVPGCGECPACELRAKGFAEAGVADPQYAA
jgi:7-cyano-7-deazaguanine synthase